MRERAACLAWALALALGYGGVLCASVCPGLGVFEILLKKVLGVGLVLTGFPLVEINQSWESRLLAVEGPGGGGWRRVGRRAKVKREDDWPHGKRRVSTGWRGP